MQVVGYWSFPLGLVNGEKKTRKESRGGGGGGGGGGDFGFGLDDIGH